MLSQKKSIRTSWVYWVTLAAICGQLALWIVSLSQWFASVRPFLALVTPTEFVQALIEKLGVLRFIQFYVLALVNILLYAAIALLLLVAMRQAKIVFLVSVVVLVAQQTLDMVLTLPGGSTRDWVTNIAGNVGLALYVLLLFLAFKNLFDTSSSGSAPNNARASEANES